ncbi:MAG: arsenic efflux protein [Clostridia bacterium]|nr:arsenic efflux protein [Clostridia bacterium]
MKIFLHLLEHSVLDTLKLLPWLVLIYIVIELLEHKTDLVGSKSRLNGKLGPLIGSATGLVPQCGFSVMAAKLFEQKYITLGTLLAIFFSTSDEAFVVLLADGAGAMYLLPLLATKMLIGIAVGYATDGILKFFKGRERAVTSTEGASLSSAQTGARELFLQRVAEDRAFECTSCGRSHDESKPWKVYFLSPLLHSLKVALFIFLVNFALGGIIELVTEERFASFMAQGKYLQPLITSMIGLIPNCASSVVITECFLENTIFFGSCVAGLCANAGLGFVVLIKNTKKWKRNLALILVSYAISVLLGILLNAIVPF